MDFSSIVAQGTSTGSYYNNKRGTFSRSTRSPRRTTPAAKNKGVELSWQQPLWNNFGMLANYTYADGKLDDGGEMLNSSKNTYNVTGYYENDRFSARLAYSYRSAYKAGVDRGASQHVDSMPSLAASVNVKIDEHLTLTFDALNLTNETIKMYAENKDRRAPSTRTAAPSTSACAASCNRGADALIAFRIGSRSGRRRLRTPPPPRTTMPIRALGRMPVQPRRGRGCSRRA